MVFKNKKIIFVFGGLVVLFLALAFKNPFNDKSQIPNMEPFPDTLLYSLPSWNWINNRGFAIKAFGLETKPLVPPTYGLLMSPFMAITHDIRGFYYGNILLALATIVVLMLMVLKLLKDNKYKLGIAGLIGFYLVSNFYFYIEPQLFMTENLTIFLVTLCFYLMLCPITLWQSLISVLTLWLTLTVKLTNLPVAMVLFSFWGLRLVVEKIWVNKKLRIPIILFSLISIVTAFGLIWNRWGPYLMTEVFGIKFFGDNFKFYFNVITGGNNRFLWYFNPLYTRDIFGLALIGLIVGLIQKKSRWFVLSIFVLILSFMVMMSFFMQTEGRHISFLFPLILILSSIAIEKLTNKFGIGILIVLLAINLIWPVTNDKVRKIVAIKRQVGLNLKYREDPWNYLAMMEFNKFFSTKNSNVYLGTLLPPFYVDLFDNGNYNYLPITKRQEFPHLWGSKYSGLTMVPAYLELLKNGNKVYVSNYYINGSQDWKQDYIELMKSFDNKLVWQSPLDNCNVYELNIKKNK